ncbi:MAG: alpha-amylase family glycosyl hydrolase [Flavisolibacter sp.]
MNREQISRTNIYEVNLRQYTTEGSIDAFLQHLPRLKNMGVETLWFMPITPISQKHRKGSMGSYYACSDYTAVATEFGTLEDWKQLVQKAHDMGFYVILDWVANHTGWDHVWTEQHPDWYKKDEYTGDFKRASGMDDIIELDFDNADMRGAMIDAMAFWVKETNIDGFRCDLAFWVRLDFWQQAKADLKNLKPLFWLGELDVLENPEYMHVFDAAYTWRWMHSAEKFYKGEADFSALQSLLHDYQQSPGLKAWFTANHDENTWNGTEYEKYGDLAAALMVFSCTWPGLPLIYSGQELPNRKRLQFFEKDVIEWSENMALHSFYQTLLSLRKDNKALSADAPVELLPVDKNAVVAFRRGEDVLVLINFSDLPVQFSLSEVKGEYRDVFSQQQFSLSKHHQLHFTPRGYLVLVNA